MGRVIFLEVLDARGQPRSRVRLDAFPSTIGRAYDNDVILDDPYVCGHHARLLVDGERTVIVEDLGSVNGVHAGSRGGRHLVLSVLPGESFRVGRTTLRLGEAGQSVAPTLMDRDGGAGRLSRALTTRVSLVALGVALVVQTLQTYFGSYERLDVADVVSDALGSLLIFAAWGGAWALASRVVSHRFSFLQHVALIAAIVAAALVVGYVVEWLVFFFPAGDALDVLSGVAYVGLATLLLYGHLSFASALSRSRRWAAAIGVTATLAAVGVALSIAGDDDFSTDLEYQSILKPARASWLSSVSIEEFAQASERLKASVDSLVDDE